MRPVRAALYLDFDNVFSGLLNLDPQAALEFAESPRSWLAKLAKEQLIDGPRRWLVLRCYLNPAGSVRRPGTSDPKDRWYFSKWRPNFVRAGFEVVDCPPLTSQQKNAADLRMALDVYDALSLTGGIEEFVIGSGDSDFTPLLARLRAADRRCAVLTANSAAEAYSALADRLIDGDEVIGLLGPTAQPTTGEARPEEAVPEPVSRLLGVVDAPHLSREDWPVVFEGFEQFISTHAYRMSEAIIWTREKVEDHGIELPRKAWNFIVRGFAQGGHPLYEQPPPTAGQMATAFTRNLLSTGVAASLSFTDSELDEVFAWFGAKRDVD